MKSGGCMKRLIVWVLVISLILMTGCDKKEESVSVKESDQLQADTTNEQVEETDPDVQENVVVSEEEVQQNNIIEEQVSLMNEDEVIQYFQEVEVQVDQATATPVVNEGMSQKLKNTFVTIVDFLFYDQPIGGMTFDMLSDTAKEKVLSIADSIDGKIENKLPGYKERIKTTTGRVYKSASSWIKEQTSTIKEKIKNAMDPDTYQSLEEGKDALVDSFKNAGEKIVEAGGTVKDRLKKWYENFRD